MDVNSSGTGWSLDRPAPRAYGEDFARHIEAFDPTFCKVLVRPEGDRALKRVSPSSRARCWAGIGMSVPPAASSA
jgi:hypothetical protein